MEDCVDSDSIYWTELGTSTIKKINKNGGSIVTLASEVNEPRAIAVDSTSAYWSEAGSLKKLPIK